MKKLQKDIDTLTQEFADCTDILTAIGDETRQHLILEMLKMKSCTGVRVNEITSKTNLSRPAVSHHLAILRKAGIVRMRREGTRNYYYFDADNDAFEKLITMLEHARAITRQLPDRSGSDD